MAVVTICSDFGAQDNKASHCFHCFLIIFITFTIVWPQFKQQGRNTILPIRTRPSSPLSYSLRSFPMSLPFTTGGQSIGASSSVLPMNIQDWFPLGLTDLISLQSKGLSRVFSNTTVRFSSVAQSCPILCDTMDCSTPGLPACHQLPGFTQTHIHWVGDAIQPSHPLSSPSPPAFNLSQHQGLFHWVSSSYQVAKILKFQLQH